jgi:SAM-dependent methyltransferase
MAHPEQQAFFSRVKAKFPDKFRRVTIYDMGSLDVNGSLKDMFEDSNYTGIDIHPGKNVDIISKVHEFTNPNLADTIVSGEMLEHDRHWVSSLNRMFQLLKPGGLMVISAAGPARAEHGTRRSGNNEQNMWGTDPDYYRNISFEMIHTWLADIYPIAEFHFEYGRNQEDSYFYLVK